MTDTPLLLVINCGSSSLKFALFPVGEPAPIFSGMAECLGQEDARLSWKSARAKGVLPLEGGAHATAMAGLMALLGDRGWVERIGAVGHRVVHGGERFKTSVLIDAGVLADIEACNELAPLHNPANLLGIRRAMARLPQVPHIAVFDTAFHQTMPPAAYLYALPRRFYDEYGVRRYGFHGTSHRYVAERAVRMLGLAADDHGLVIAHLGNGASATAVLNGRSVDTSMGMTPLEGLVMGTRSGDVDPGALGHIARRSGMTLDQLDTVLNKNSGLLGLSGLSNDCRSLQAAEAEGHDGARLALEVFVHRLARYIGGLATSLPRLDAVVFTGGIGENAAAIRAATLDRLRTLGLDLDHQANERMVGGRSGLISRGQAPAAAVVNTNEEWMIARDTAELAGLAVRPASALAA